jgi:hypothetical protein
MLWRACWRRPAPTPGRSRPGPAPGPGCGATGWPANGSCCCRAALTWRPGAPAGADPVVPRHERQDQPVRGQRHATLERKRPRRRPGTGAGQRHHDSAGGSRREPDAHPDDLRCGGAVTRCASVNKPLVFPGGRHASPVAGFTVRVIVDRCPVVSEVMIHDDATLHGKQPEDDGRRICGLIRHAESSWTWRKASCISGCNDLYSCGVYAAWPEPEPSLSCWRPLLPWWRSGAPAVTIRGKQHVRPRRHPGRPRRCPARRARAPPVPRTRPLRSGLSRPVQRYCTFWRICERFPSARPCRRTCMFEVSGPGPTSTPVTQGADTPGRRRY